MMKTNNINSSNDKESDFVIVSVPHGVRGGGKFPVTILGKEFFVTCPPNAGPGAKVRLALRDLKKNSDESLLYPTSEATNIEIASPPSLDDPSNSKSKIKNDDEAKKKKHHPEAHKKSELSDAELKRKSDELLYLSAPGRSEEMELDTEMVARICFSLWKQMTYQLYNGGPRRHLEYTRTSRATPELQ